MELADFQEGKTHIHPIAKMICDQVIDLTKFVTIADKDNEIYYYDTTNKLATLTLLDQGYDLVWLKPHTKRHDMVYSQQGNFRCLDLFNLFDGICFFNETPIFIQIKTNAWASIKPIKEFLKRRKVKVLIINVTNKLKECEGKYKVKIREVTP